MRELTTIEIKDFKEFDKFEYLLIPYNFKVSKKFETQLEKDAIAWFKGLDAKFGATTICTNKGDNFTWHYSVGSLIFGVQPIGDYFYKHIVFALHNQFWNKKSFTDGFEFGKGVHEKTIIQIGNGKDNPFSKNDVLDHHSWNTGFTWGLYNLKIKFI